MRREEPGAKVENFTGIVRRINRAGLALLEDPRTKTPYVFTFDKIHNYRGETAEQLGLRVGSKVRVRAIGETVQSVEIVADCDRAA